MNRPDPLQTLLDRYLEGTLADDELAQLEASLQNDPAVAAQLVQLAAVDELLETFHRDERSLSEASDLLAQLGLEAPAHEAAAPLPSAQPTRPAALDWRHHPLRFWATAATLTLVMWSGLMMYWSNEQPSREPLTAGGHMPHLVGRVVRSVAAQWSPQSAAFDGAHLRAAQMLELQSGLAELALRDGTQVILEGPCAVQLLADDAVRLLRGRLTARVPPQAVGFQVHAPDWTIRDLGTEFGAEVVPGAAGEVAVFSGAVEIRWAGQGDAPWQVQRVDAGEALRVVSSSRQVESLAVDAEKFVRLLPRLEPRAVEIANSSFELPELAAREVWRDNIAHWHAGDASNSGVSRFGSEFFAGTPDGRQMAFLNAGEIRQELAETLAPHTSYRLSVQVGNRPGKLAPGYVLELRAGDTLLAANSNGALPGDGFFAEAVVRFTTGESHAALGQPLVIALRSTGSLDTDTQNHFDQVRLDATPLGK